MGLWVGKPGLLVLCVREPNRSKICTKDESPICCAPCNDELALHRLFPACSQCKQYPFPNPFPRKTINYTEEIEFTPVSNQNMIHIRFEIKLKFFLIPIFHSYGYFS